MSPRSPPLAVAAVRESVTRYAVRSDTPLGSGVAEAGVASAFRTTRRSPTPAQVSVTILDPEGADGDPDGSPDAGLIENSDGATTSATETTAVRAEPRNQFLSRFTASLCLISHEPAGSFARGSSPHPRRRKAAMSADTAFEPDLQRLSAPARDGFAPQITAKCTTTPSSAGDSVRRASSRRRETPASPGVGPGRPGPARQADLAPPAPRSHADEQPPAPCVVWRRPGRRPLTAGTSESR